jgi:large subunit ribosomal protein L32e
LLQKKSVKPHKKLKAKKPRFIRQEAWRYKRLKASWRKPRGKTSKMRRRLKGWPKIPDIGFKTQKTIRGLHPSGYEEVLVHNPEELDRVNPKREVVRIAHTVGERKRVAILDKAKELELTVLNPGTLRKAEAEKIEEEGPRETGESSER